MALVLGQVSLALAMVNLMGSGLGTSAVGLAVGLLVLTPGLYRNGRTRDLLALAPVFASAALPMWWPMLLMTIVAMGVLVLMEHRPEQPAVEPVMDGLFKQRLKRYPQLLRACNELGRCERREDLGRVLVHHARSIGGKTSSVGVFFRGESGNLVVCAHEGSTEPFVPDNEDFSVVTGGRSVIRRDTGGLRLHLALTGVESGTVGVLSALLKTPIHEDPFHREMLVTLAKLGGMSLGAVDLLQKTRDLAIRDSLTGLFGRHEFMARLTEECSRAGRTGNPLGLIMCDLDHLKNLNDTHGHLAGDEALKLVADCLREIGGTTGMACRYGGEEFTLLLPEHDGVATADVAERIIVSIRNRRLKRKNKTIRMTASCGWASLSANEDPMSLLKRADEALYAAKGQGRDRVVGAES